MEAHRSQKEWDIHFMKEARLWMPMSKCLSRKIGTVLVKDNRVIATGYNGPPSGIPHCDHRIIDVASVQAPYVDYVVDETCPRRRLGIPSGEGLELCPAVHAEINPIIQAAKMHISTEGATLYCYCGTPCINCSKELIQAGVKRIVCLAKSGDRNWDTPIKDGDNPDKREFNFTLSEELLRLAGVQLDIITEEELG